MNKFALTGLAVLAALSAAVWAQAPSTPAGTWVNVTNNVGGPKWADYGMHMLTCAPGKDTDEVIAGVSGVGLWASADGGAKWVQLGDQGSTKITARPTSIVWDPKDPKTYWVSAIYGAGLFKTTDGGKSFERVGKLDAIDSVAVDFSDPERKLLLVCHHESAQSLEKSTDGGKTWEKIGKNLPAKTNHTTNAIIIDAKTYLVNCAGWLPGASMGIYRTEDGGTTWTKVSDQGPAGAPLVTADGTIYWQRIWGGGLLKSTDKGQTWNQLGGPVKSNVLDVPAGSKLGGKDGGLLGWSDKGIYASRDGGKNWVTLNTKLPVKPTSAAYDAKRNCVFLSLLEAKQNTNAVWRLDLPDE
jgi:photosystem II stability/assembly factor-like uncharacterized protein